MTWLEIFLGLCLCFFWSQLFPGQIDPSSHSHGPFADQQGAEQAGVGVEDGQDEVRIRKMKMPEHSMPVTDAWCR